MAGTGYLEWSGGYGPQMVALGIKASHLCPRFLLRFVDFLYFFSDGKVSGERDLREENRLGMFLGG